MKKIYQSSLYGSISCKTLFLTVILWAGVLMYGYAQTKFEFTGKVTNSGGEPMPGVSVVITGTTSGVMTDLNGNFSLMNEKPVLKLTISYVGMKSQEIEAKANVPVVVALEEKSSDLAGVLVVGYGVQKKSLVTGAISQIKGDELRNVPTSRVEQAMQGKIAGVQVRSSSGSPGAGMKVRIRGTGTNGNSDPLYIVDGMKSTDITYLEPSDIESMEVLKDAASAAIYGAEGGNGVIIITTKSGKGVIGAKNTGGTINFDYQFGYQNVGKMMKVMNTSEYTTYINEANVGVTIPTGVTTDTKWMDEIASSAPMQKVYLSFANSTDKSSYVLSGSYYGQEGVIGGNKSDFKRYTARFNGNHEVKNWLTVGNNIAYSHTDRSAIVENDEFNGVVASALMLDPLTPTVYTGALPEFAQTALDDGAHLVKDSEGRYYGVSEFVKGEIANPLAEIQIAKGSTIQDKVIGNVFATVKPYKGLEITTRYGMDYAGQIYHTWNPTFWFSSERNSSVTSRRENYDKWFTWLWENFATYNFKVGRGNFTAVAGTAAQKSVHNFVTTLSGPMFAEADPFSYHGGVEINGSLSGNMEDKRLQSYFGRLSYDYAGKYMINGTLRRDGTSLLSKKWGTFPSLSAGWVISEEDFFKNLNSPVTNLKVRASWGQNGSLSNLGYDQFRALIRTSGIQYPDGNGGFYTGAEPELLANPELKWETSEQTDLGVDLRLLNNKLRFSVDYYNKVTKDLLTPSSPPLSVGNSAPFVNAGDVTNRGFEFELGYQESGGEFHYNVVLNFATLHNEVTYLNPLLKRQSGDVVGTGWTATYMEKGLPVWYFRGYQTDGIFQNQAQIDKYIADNGLVGYAPKPGDPIIVNNKKDANINEDDMVKIGSPHPKATFGANLSCDYKNFDLNIFMQGTFGNDILMGWNRSDRGTSNRPEFFYTDRWTGDGSTNSWFRSDLTNPYVYYSDLMVFDGSYLRIKHIQLGYTMPKSFASKIYLSSCRFFLSFDDYFTFTKYPGMDVEAGNNDNFSQGIDKGFYPTPRKVMAGVSVSL